MDLFKCLLILAISIVPYIGAQQSPPYCNSNQNCMSLGQSAFCDLNARICRCGSGTHYNGRVCESHPTGPNFPGACQNNQDCAHLGREGFCDPFARKCLCNQNFYLQNNRCVPNNNQGFPGPNPTTTCTSDRECRLHGNEATCNVYLRKCECSGNSQFNGQICVAANTPGILEDDPNAPIVNCADDQQCQRSMFGPLSVCSDQKCKCYDTVSGGKNPVRFYNNRCVISKMHGENCDNDEQCKAGHHEDSFCDKQDPGFGGTGVCKCRPGYTCELDNNAGVTFQSVFVVAASTVALGFIATQIVV